MKDPILKFELYSAETKQSTLISKIQLQYFSPEHTFNLYTHEYVKRYDTHFYTKCGERNSREHEHKVLFGTNGYIFSFAKVYAQNAEFKEHDHLVVSFSGYDGNDSNKFILDLAQYRLLSTAQHQPIIDDYDLLMQKYKEISNT